ncbi:MAG: Na+/H+ antiporter NhaA [Solirubrobacterales bacterium]|nr:Na+/H+ antiporter NhaA [Solirubrobacterales bacterium]
MAESEGVSFSGRTAWARTLQTPLREFLQTEAGGAAVLLAGAVAALVWINVDSGSYESLWHTTLSIRLGGGEVSHDLRNWVNRGLMTFFFFVIGLEARREFDMGELRERRRAALPLVAALGAMVTPVAIYLLFNAGRSSAHGWGTAMSTDTAFALGMLALLSARAPARLRTFILTLSVVDDLVALVVIATVYTAHVDVTALLAALGFFGAILVARAAGTRRGIVYAALGVATWVALDRSGVDPVVVGLAMGLLTYAYPAGRSELETASERFRLFREQPTPELASAARESVEAAISPNELLAHRYHPWTSYVIVPLFALANAGIVINGSFLAHAFTSPITLGILVGYVVGKPLGLFGGTSLVSVVSGGRVQPPVGWLARVGGGTIAGIGVTVSLLIGSLAFHGAQLQEAKLGVLSAAVLASALTWLVFHASDLLPADARRRALLGPSQRLVDLAVAVDPERDHLRGPLGAPITLVEYGDFECPYCGQAEGVVRELLGDFNDLDYVWRHLPLNDVHPHAQLAAEAAEAAAAQGAFWEMHDLLMDNQDALGPRDLFGYASQLGLDAERFREELRGHAHATRVASDIEGADFSNVSGTPTFFINGRRHLGAYDVATLTRAVQAARERAELERTRALAG